MCTLPPETQVIKFGNVSELVDQLVVELALVLPVPLLLLAEEDWWESIVALVDR